LIYGTDKGPFSVAAVNEYSSTISILLNRGQSGTVSTAMTCVSSSGTLPFSSRFVLTLTNNFAEQARRFAYQLDVDLADGPYYTNWRRGSLSLLGGADLVAGHPGADLADR
jgi:hypothetical protein